MSDSTFETTLRPMSLEVATESLRRALVRFAERYPGDDGRRQPVHTVYGGAHLFKAGSAGKLGALALRHFEEYFPDPLTLARVLQFPGHGDLPWRELELEALLADLSHDPERVRREQPALWLADTVHRRVLAKLASEPVEDFRIDFEDGFGHRPDAEEDAEAVRAAGEVARGLVDGSLPPFLGIRIKSFAERTRARSIRTLDLFLTALATASDRALPERFVVTLPKVSLEEEVAALVSVFRQLEAGLGLGEGSLRLELMVETPQVISDAQGGTALPRLVAAAEGRCEGAHFGVYDYTAACGIVAGHQSMRHPACDHARHVMQVALAGTGIHLSNGATHLIPTGPHRPKGERGLDTTQVRENHEAVHGTSKVIYDDIRHSLHHGFYQGWDLHPAQLPIRYAAVHAFFLEQLEPMTERLSSFVHSATQAHLVGDVFDDAASGQGLLQFFRAGLTCGALTEVELESTGLTAEALKSRSFESIVEASRA